MMIAGESDHGDPENYPMMQAEGKYDGATKNIDGLAKPNWPNNLSNCPESMNEPKGSLPWSQTA
jgi:hypothetical protein